MPVRGDKTILKKSVTFLLHLPVSPPSWALSQQRTVSPNFRVYTQAPQSVRHSHVCSSTGWICVRNLCVCLRQKCARTDTWDWFRGSLQPLIICCGRLILKTGIFTFSCTFLEKLDPNHSCFKSSCFPIPRKTPILIRPAEVIATNDLAN